MSPLEAEQPLSQPILVLVRDLIFASRITATARALAIPVTLVRDVAKLIEHDAKTVIVDLNQPSALETAVGWKQAREGRTVIGFVSHVDADTIRRAREAGIDRVLPRSRFVTELPSLLRAG